MIELQQLQEQILKSPIRERWHLVKIILASIQQETLSSTPPQPTIENFSELDPWTQSLIGVINLETENTITSQPHPLKTFIEKYGT